MRAAFEALPEQKGSKGCRRLGAAPKPLLAALGSRAMQEEAAALCPSALTVKPEWLSLILSGCKTWELRSKPCRKDPKAFVALLASGTSTVWGFCQIDGSSSRWRSLRQLRSASARSKHQVSEAELQSLTDLRKAGQAGRESREPGAYAWRLRRPRVLVLLLFWGLEGFSGRLQGPCRSLPPCLLSSPLWRAGAASRRLAAFGQRELASPRGLGARGAGAPPELRRPSPPSFPFIRGGQRDLE